jgi:hypothetical protein
MLYCRYLPTVFPLHRIPVIYKQPREGIEARQPNEGKGVATLPKLWKYNVQRRIYKPRQNSVVGCRGPQSLQPPDPGVLMHRPPPHPPVVSPSTSTDIRASQPQRPA